MAAPPRHSNSSWMNKSSASTGTTEGSTTSSSPASSVNLVTTNTHISQPQQPNNNNNNNAPKYGTLVPNRIFVGGISGSTTETELAQLFSTYGNVKATKVISDRAGVSKGYGFVTFETEEEAKRLMSDSECIVLKERKLNIAPAIKKQPFNRTYEAASPPAVHSNTIFYQNGVPYTFHNGVAYFPATATQHAATTGTIPTAGDPAGVYPAAFGPPPAAPTHSPAATSYPVIYPYTAPPAMYMTPQLQYQPMPPPAPASQYMYATSTSSTSAAAPGNGPPAATATQGSPMMGAPAPMPPAQHFYAHMNPPDLYYTIPQSYMISNEGIVYETPPQTETSSNQSAEDSCSNSSNSDTIRSGGGGNFKPPPNQEKMVPKCDNTQSQRQNAATPVVSLLKLEDADNKTPAFYQHVPPPPIHKIPPPQFMYQSIPPMFVSAHTTGSSPYQHYPSPIPNGHSDQNRPSFNSKPFCNRRNSTSPMSVNIPPFPPKFHFMNNNNNNVKRQYNRFQNHRGMRFQGPNTRRFFPNKREDGTPLSPPPPPYSSMVPSDSSCVSPTQQVQYRSAAPPPPRRFINSARKTNGNNNSSCRNNGNNVSKYKNVMTTKVVDEGGAGDAPVQDTCNQFQALSL